MGKVDCFEVAGIELYLLSSDHLPEHFHARKPGEWEIRVFFLTSTETGLVYGVKWKRRNGPSASVIKELLSNVLANREALLIEWQRKVCPR